MRTRTPGTARGHGGLHLHRHGRERSDGDGEDEAHRQCHHPDLLDEETKTGPVSSITLISMHLVAVQIEDEHKV